MNDGRPYQLARPSPAWLAQRRLTAEDEGDVEVEVVVLVEDGGQV